MLRLSRDFSAPLEGKLQSQLHAPLELGVGVFSKGWVHLGKIDQLIKLELCVGIHRGAIGVIEDIIDFGTELELNALAGHGDLLEERHIPVVNSRSTEVVPWTKAGCTLLRPL